MTSLPNPRTMRSVTSMRGDGDERSRPAGFAWRFVSQTVRWVGIWGAACLVFASQNAGAAHAAQSALPVQRAALGGDADDDRPRGHAPCARAAERPASDDAR